MVKQFNALPSSGGVLDQDAGIMIGIMMVLDAYEERRQLDKRREARRKGR